MFSKLIHLVISKPASWEIAVKQRCCALVGTFSFTKRPAHWKTTALLGGRFTKLPVTVARQYRFGPRPNVQHYVTSGKAAAYSTHQESIWSSSI